MIAFYTTFMREHLLTPSLSASAPPVSLYSIRSSFFVAFLGGPAAIILYSTLNSWRLRRVLDIPAYLIAIILFVLLVYGTRGDVAYFAWLREQLGSDTTRFLSRGLALALCGLFYLLHKKQHRSATLFGSKAPSPWIPAIASTVLGYAATVGVAALLLRGAA
ncbi:MULTISPECIES: hypothetical protein [unclassified Duganella]|uniref:hypothetical protein n=2 Tax=Duganella TaxID=75654 RepID=UPI0011C116EB|nr:MULTISPECIES: hypothetical protein [unclassified Duganella]